MINKEEDYLTTRLKQLKSSVLANQTAGTPKLDLGPTRPVASIVEPPVQIDPQRSYEPAMVPSKVAGGHVTFGQNEVISPYPKSILRNGDPTKIENGLPIRLYNNSSVKMTLPEYEAKTEVENMRTTNDVLLGPEIRRPRSQEIIEDMKGSYTTTIAPITERQVIYGQTLPTTYLRQNLQQTIPMSKSTEPLSRTMYANNPTSGPFSALQTSNVNPLTDFARYLRMPQAQPIPQSNYGLNTVSLEPRIKADILSMAPAKTIITQSIAPNQTMTASLPLKSIPVTTQYITSPSANPTDLLESINLQKQSNVDATSLQFLETLNRQIIDQINKNNLLVNQIANMNKALEREKQATVTINSQLQNELKHLKEEDADTTKKFQDLENHMVTHSRRRIDISGQSSDLTQKYERLINDNEKLRSELKRMAELSSNKILDVENGINSIARMRTLESENHNMEKDKLQNHADFVAEQIRVQFIERTKEIEAQLAANEELRIRAETDLKTIQNELANYNQYAELKMNNELGIAIHKEEERAERERKAMQDQVDNEEAQVKECNRLIEEGINKVGRLETDTKARLGARKAENLRLRDDLMNEDAVYKRLLIQMTNEKSSYDTKNDQLLDSKEELQDIKARIALLDSRYNDEVNGLARDGAERSKAIEEEIFRLEGAEKTLLRAIEAEKQKIAELLQEQKQMVSQVEATLSKAISQSTQGRQIK